MKSSLILTLIILASSALGKPYPPELPDVREMAYKTVGETKLKLWIVEPERHKKSDKGTAVIFFGVNGDRANRPSMPS